ncbi:MAG: hydroxymethylbilane synthase [Polyangiaceae bacterium]
MKIVYATRKSLLALAQCRAFIARVKAAHPDIEFVEEQVVTSGDRIQDRPLADIGGKGLFVKEIEEALLEKRADIAVHSIKDVPAFLPEGLSIVCIPLREDPRDVLVAPKYKTLAALPKGAKVGTSSLRREVSLKAARPDLQIVPMRGNVDTRLRKVDAGECDAIVLARAGLVRLSLEDRATEILEPELSLPAVGQGALGIEARSDDENVKVILSKVHHLGTAIAVAAERGVMEALGGDCKTPLGAYAQVVESSLFLRAFIANADGTHRRAGERVVPHPMSEEDARAIGQELGRSIL